MPDEPVDEDERATLLRRVDSGTATLGTQLPESVTVDGTVLPLREFVVETRRQTALEPEERDRVRAVRDRLRVERERRRDRLADADLTAADARALADTIVGLDRAIAALADLRERSLEADAHERTVASHRSWLEFLDRIQD